jgi:hypothetical protein
MTGVPSQAQGPPVEPDAEPVEASVPTENSVMLVPDKLSDRSSTQYFIDF